MCKESDGGLPCLADTKHLKQTLCKYNLSKQSAASRVPYLHCLDKPMCIQQVHAMGLFPQISELAIAVLTLTTIIFNKHNTLTENDWCEVKKVSMGWCPLLLGYYIY